MQICRYITIFLRCLQQADERVCFTRNPARVYFGRMTKDLTEGRPLPLILSFSLPVMMGFLFQQLYNVVDTVIVGQILGKGALAAVGSTGSVNFLILGFCNGVTNGFALPIAQKFGAKDYRTMRQFLAMNTVLSVVIAAIMTTLTVILCKPLLLLMTTPPDIVDDAVLYIRIIFAGIPATFLYNTLANTLRSVGDSRTPLIFLIISSVLNIGLDLLFILVFGLGVQGAAIATVLAQLLSGIACFIYMKKKFDILRLSKDDRKFRPEHIGPLCNMGLPMGFQYSITAIGSVILQSSINGLGSDAVAAFAAAIKIHMVYCIVFDSMGTTMGTWSGQNTGAKKFDRLWSGVRDASLLCLAYSAVIFVFNCFFGDKLGLLFLSDPGEEILTNIHHFLMANSGFYFPLALVNIIRFSIQGMGWSKLAVTSGVLEMVARALTGLFLVPAFGFIAVCFASPLAWILAIAFLIPAFFLCKKQLEK